MSSPTVGSLVHVTGTINASNRTVNTAPLSINLGSAIFVFCTAFNTTFGFSANDNQGDVYQSAGNSALDNPDGVILTCLYSPNCNTSSNTVVSVTSNVNGSIEYYVVEMVGANVTAKDQYYSNGGALGNPTHGPVNTSSTNEYVLSFFSDNGTQFTSLTPSNGFSVLSNSVSTVLMGATAANIGTYDPAIAWTPTGGFTTIISVSVFGSSGSGTIPKIFKLYSNGAIQANSFTANVVLPPNVVLRFGANNVLQANGLITQSGAGKIKIQSNGQLICNNTIVV
jgi:hypothetical protein